MYHFQLIYTAYKKVELGEGHETLVIIETILDWP
jgi:hypothetical protein